MTKRNTIQGALVLDAVNQLASHATADDVYQYVRQEHPTISKATVYRNLRSLAEEGQIRSVNVPGGAERFDHIQVPHYHFKCDKCGQVFEVELDYLTELAQQIRNAGDFDILDHDIVFRGLCPDCKNATIARN